MEQKAQYNGRRTHSFQPTFVPTTKVKPTATITHDQPQNGFRSSLNSEVLLIQPEFHRTGLSTEKAKENLKRRTNYDPMAAKSRPSIYGKKSEYGQENLNKSSDQKQQAYRLQKMYAKHPYQETGLRRFDQINQTLQSEAVKQLTTLNSFQRQQNKQLTALNTYANTSKNLTSKQTRRQKDFTFGDDNNKWINQIKQQNEAMISNWIDKYKNTSSPVADAEKVDANSREPSLRKEEEKKDQSLKAGQPKFTTVLNSVNVSKEDDHKLQTLIQSVPIKTTVFMPINNWGAKTDDDAESKTLNTTVQNRVGFTRESEIKFQTPNTLAPAKKTESELSEFVATNNLGLRADYEGERKRTLQTTVQNRVGFTRESEIKFQTPNTSAPDKMNESEFVTTNDLRSRADFDGDRKSTLTTTVQNRVGFTRESEIKFQTPNTSAPAKTTESELSEFVATNNLGLRADYEGERKSTLPSTMQSRVGVAKESDIKLQTPNSSAPIQTTESEFVSATNYGMKTIFDVERKSTFTFVSNSDSVGNEDGLNFTNPNISVPTKTTVDYQMEKKSSFISNEKISTAYQSTFTASKVDTTFKFNPSILQSQDFEKKDMANSAQFSKGLQVSTLRHEARFVQSEKQAEQPNAIQSFKINDQNNSKIIEESPNISPFSRSEPVSEQEERRQGGSVTKFKKSTRNFKQNPAKSILQESPLGPTTKSSIMEIEQLQISESHEVLPTQNQPIFQSVAQSINTASTGDFQKYGYKSSNIQQVVLNSKVQDFRNVSSASPNKKSVFQTEKRLVETQTKEKEHPTWSSTILPYQSPRASRLKVQVEQNAGPDEQVEQVNIKLPKGQAPGGNERQYQLIEAQSKKVVPKTDSKKPQKKADLLVNSDDRPAQVGKKLEQRQTISYPNENIQAKKKETKVSKKKGTYEEQQISLLNKLEENINKKIEFTNIKLKSPKRLQLKTSTSNERYKSPISTQSPVHNSYGSSIYGSYQLREGEGLKYCTACTKDQIHPYNKNMHTSSVKGLFSSGKRK